MFGETTYTLTDLEELGISQKNHINGSCVTSELPLTNLDIVFVKGVMEYLYKKIGKELPNDFFIITAEFVFKDLLKELPEDLTDGNIQKESPMLTETEYQTILCQIGMNYPCHHLTQQQKAQLESIIAQRIKASHASIFEQLLTPPLEKIPSCQQEFELVD